MSHNPNRNLVRRAETQKAIEDERVMAPKRKAARHLMAQWNAHLATGWRAMFYPSIRTALLAECHWIHVVCPACDIMGEVDLRTVDIHPEANIATVVRAMSCQRCSPHPPFARPLGVTPRPWSGYLAGRPEDVSRALKQWVDLRPPTGRSRRQPPVTEIPEDEGWGQRMARQNKRG